MNKFICIALLIAFVPMFQSDGGALYRYQKLKEYVKTYDFRHPNSTVFGNTSSCPKSVKTDGFYRGIGEIVNARRNGEIR